MIETADLPGADLPDGTAASQRGGTNGSVNGFSSRYGPGSEPANPEQDTPRDIGTMSAADIAKGYMPINVKRTPFFAPDDTGEISVGNIFEAGGFLGRPQGTAR